MQASQLQVQSTGTAVDPLIFCLTACLDDVEVHSPESARHLRAAIRRLGHPAWAAGAFGRPSVPDALARYLEHIVPDVDLLCGEAACLVRRAVSSLRETPQSRRRH